MPRRYNPLRVGLGPWFGLWPMPLGQSPNQGLSPIYKRNGYGGAEPRLTSGGKAGVDGVKSQDRLLLFKAVSHKAAKPEWMESSLKIGFCFSKRYLTRRQSRSGWSQVSRSAFAFQSGISQGGKAGVDGVKSQDRLLLFKAVSHKAAKPEWMESSLKIGFCFSKRYLTRRQSRSGWSQVS